MATLSVQVSLDDKGVWLVCFIGFCHSFIVSIALWRVRYCHPCLSHLLDSSVCFCSLQIFQCHFEYIRRHRSHHLPKRRDRCHPWCITEQVKMDSIGDGCSGGNLHQCSTWPETCAHRLPELLIVMAMFYRKCLSRLDQHFLWMFATSVWRLTKELAGVKLSYFHCDAICDTRDVHSAIQAVRRGMNDREWPYK